ncbi:hypothetical protein D3C86_1866850 [compost metagenome]
MQHFHKQLIFEYHPVILPGSNGRLANLVYLNLLRFFGYHCLLGGKEHQSGLAGFATHLYAHLAGFDCYFNVRVVLVRFYVE